MAKDERLLSVWVAGIAATKGSLDVVNKQTGAVSMSERSKRWEATMAREIATAVKAGAWEPLSEECCVELQFHLTWPDPTNPRAGDVDKLERCALDALKRGGAYTDDRFVVETYPRKFGFTLGAQPGVHILLRPGRFA